MSEAEVLTAVDADVEAAPASPPSPETFTCPACGHTDKLGDIAPEREIIKCDECEARIAYGVLMPRVVVQPAADRRFCEVLVEERRHGEEPKAVRIQFDRAFGHLVAENILSITRP